MIVVDTNVTAYLWLRGELTPAAERLFEAEPEWAVPMVWRSEFRNVLIGFVRRKLCALEDAISVSRAAEEMLSGRELAVDSAEVLRLADVSGCSAYDCEFVALAGALGVRLVTNDREILKRFPALAVALQSYRS